jgi:hypothetical protein
MDTVIQYLVLHILHLSLFFFPYMFVSKSHYEFYKDIREMAYSKVCGRLNNSDCFCYLCGEFTPKAQLKTSSPLIKNAYKFYFGCALGDQDKKWAPHTLCLACCDTS